jgi:hypothetical protein
MQLKVFQQCGVDRDDLPVETVFVVRGLILPQL